MATANSGVSKGKGQKSGEDSDRSLSSESCVDRKDTLSNVVSECKNEGSNKDKEVKAVKALHDHTHNERQKKAVKDILGQAREKALGEGEGFHASTRLSSNSLSSSFQALDIHSSCPEPGAFTSSSRRSSVFVSRSNEKLADASNFIDFLENIKAAKEAEDSKNQDLTVQTVHSKPNSQIETTRDQENNIKIGAPFLQVEYKDNSTWTQEDQVLRGSHHPHLIVRTSSLSEIDSSLSVESPVTARGRATRSFKEKSVIEDTASAATVLQTESIGVGSTTQSKKGRRILHTNTTNIERGVSPAFHPHQQGFLQYIGPNKSSFIENHSKKSKKRGKVTRESLSNPLGLQYSPIECYSVSSHLMDRESRLYENTPKTQRELENLDILLRDRHSGLRVPFNSSHPNLNCGIASNPNELLSATELLSKNGSSSNAGGLAAPLGPPSWGDSGRESLSFDGENNNSNNSNHGSCRNLMLIPPPPPPTSFSSAMDSSGTPGGSQYSHKNSGNRRGKLVRQKNSIVEFDQSNSKGPASYLAVPQPRGSSIINGSSHLNFSSAVSPIMLQRHQVPEHLMLQENKKNRSLIPSHDYPYGETGMGGSRSCSNGHTAYQEYLQSRHLLLNRSRSPYSFHHGNESISGSSRIGARIKNHNQSVDYGELPSHQMFPKRSINTKILNNLHMSNASNNGLNNAALNSNNLTGLLMQHAPAHQPHRSIPANLFSSTAKSCSLGDLTSSTNSPGHVSHGIPMSAKGNAGMSYKCSTDQPQKNGENGDGHGGRNGNLSSVPLVASLPLPPATSITYEFNLAPMNGTSAPGWHLTAVQRGLATAVPLAAAVARRRLPRPRAGRSRFGFSDKAEARRAKWTIVVTALALLAMSMLLVGITLRLAPLIDDLVRKENENLLRVINQNAPIGNRSASAPESSTLSSSSEFEEEFRYNEVEKHGGPAKGKSMNWNSSVSSDVILNRETQTQSQKILLNPSIRSRSSAQASSSKRLTPIFNFRRRDDHHVMESATTKNWHNKNFSYQSNPTRHSAKKLEEHSVLFPNEIYTTRSTLEQSTIRLIKSISFQNGDDFSRSLQTKLLQILKQRKTSQTKK